MPSQSSRGTDSEEEAPQSGPDHTATALNSGCRHRAKLRPIIGRQPTNEMLYVGQTAQFVATGGNTDHNCLELEFMCVLAAKEAYALEHHLDADQLALCHEAQKKLLREHLGRWTPAFTRRLAAATIEPTLLALAEFTHYFIESECTRFGINAGSEDLLLRPVDEAADSTCASCGINLLPPGALATA